ncbi:MAG TPA: YggS family pyridoxal phosphate-dependent enzyme [Actinobacteria bacterium]|nr:YggS family pyridoxal phosphate-dependent enzyme [Actinomycetes bacterium]HEX21496.1 YggS family pyridoxal phosphate-dependent enzyme [Actinomycetota bacterium]
MVNNIKSVKERIAATCAQVGRRPDEIKMVAVSKTVDTIKALEAVQAGVTDLGENRTAEMAAKYRFIGDKAKWHFIGHLQKNKVKKIINFVDLIHSLDSLSLAEEIDTRARQINKVQPALIELNISGEKSKYGLHPDEVFAFIKEVNNFTNLKIVGLMTMAPWGASFEQARQIFRGLRKLRDDLQPNIPDITRLSMGMTDDFEAAILEGADIVRIGRAIFNN